MQKVFYFILIIFSYSSIIEADIYIKRRVRQESYYYAGQVVPAEEYVIEQWIGFDKMVTTRDNWITIVNMEIKTICFINRIDSTYVQANLPFDWNQVVGEELIPRLNAMAFVGTIVPGKANKNINDYECEEYNINRYFIYQGNKYYETDITEWVTKDINLDIDNFLKLNNIMWQIENYGEEILKEFPNMYGFPVASDSYFYPRGFAVKTTVYPDELIESEPPANIYEVPQGFERKDKLTTEELYSL
ncbi:hypothetical protein ACFLR4_04625 [Bacteroidota bacterium]